jgi:GNAT superfamily N-acetyltransferase
MTPTTIHLLNIENIGFLFFSFLCSQLPDGYSFSELGSSEANLVNSEWDYNIKDKTVPYIRNLILTMPHACVRDSLTNAPVAYELTFVFGAMAILYVRPNYRRKGLAKAVICSLARKHLDRGRHAFCWVDVDNSTSIRLHEQCGLTFIDDYETMIMAYTPASQTDVLLDIKK